MKKIESVSYAGKPVSHTAMYITKKVEYLLTNLEAVEGCLVFAEDTISVPEEVSKRHEFVMTKPPQRDNAVFINQLAEEKAKADSLRTYRLTEDGYYIGENVRIGENTVIEPGAFIGHDVVIGPNSVIKTGARIKDTIAGEGLIACESCTIGTTGFTMADDENGDKIRIPTLGKVVIGKHVEIGSLTNVSCGSAGNTVLEDHVKVDSLVHLGHDVYLGRNVEIPAGAIIGGFCVLEEGAYVGVNATLRNRIRIGKNAFIGMGAVVTKSVDDGITVVGNPAKPFIKK